MASLVKLIAVAGIVPFLMGRFYLFQLKNNDIKNIPKAIENYF